MAEEIETSWWADTLAVYRDVELAKRAQPKLVQGAAQVQVPFQQNVNAPQTPQNITSSTGSIINSTLLPKVLLYGGLGLLGIALVFKFKR